MVKKRGEIRIENEIWKDWYVRLYETTEIMAGFLLAKISGPAALA